MQKKKKRMYDGGKSVLHVKIVQAVFTKLRKQEDLERTACIFQVEEYVPNMINGAVLQTAPVMKKENRGLEI